MTHPVQLRPGRGPATRAVRLARGVRLASLALASLALASLALVGLAWGRPLAAGAQGADPAADAVRSADWLAARVSPDGTIESEYQPGTVDWPATMNSLLVFAATRSNGTVAQRVLGTLAADPGVAVQVAGVDDPGRLATLILGVVALGADPHSFGGTGAAGDLVARLEATMRSSVPDIGLFGSADPTYDGAYRQGLALLAFGAAGVTPPAASVGWLTDQQCGDGSWMSYRSDPTVDCPPSDPATYSGPDTNSTALAALGLGAVGAVPKADPVPWLAAAQNPDGGWAYTPGADNAGTDPNSTALVVWALTASDQLDGRFEKSGGTPITALRSFQLTCDSPTPDRWAFTYPGTDGVPNLMATLQATVALSGVKLPLGPVTFDVVSEPACVPTTTTVPVTTVPVTTVLATTAPATTAPATTVPVGPVPAELARTGRADRRLAALGSALVVAGLGLSQLSRRRIR